LETGLQDAILPHKAAAGKIACPTKWKIIVAGEETDGAEL
jgi:hypothetical protein